MISLHKVKHLFVGLMVLIGLSGQLKAQNPSWSVNPLSYANSMNVVGFLWINGVESQDPNDVVAAFVNDQVQGVASPMYVPQLDRYVVFMSIYNNQSTGTVNFKIFDASSNEVLEIPNSVSFMPDGLIGGLEESFVWSNIALNSEASIVSFSIPSQYGQTVIDGTQISISSNLELAEELSSQIAYFNVTEGASVTIGEVEQKSGITVNDFTNAIVYRVQSEDLLTINEYEVTVTVVNRAPEAINLDNLDIDENLSNNLFIGTLTTVDEDPSDKHTYSLVSGIGASDNALFTVSENSVLTKNPFNHEEAATRDIRVRSTDSFGKTVEKAFTIQVNDINDSPTLIQLSANTVNENESVDILIANLSATDEDEGESFRYELASGAGSGDNGLFQIDGDKLMTKSSYNYEQNSQLQIRLKVTDSGGATYTEGFVITVIDKNDIPSSVQISNNSIDENLTDVAIGTLSTVDEDLVDSYKYELITGTGDTDNGLFSITGALLSSQTPFDFEEMATRSIRVKSTDLAGTSVEQVIKIEIKDTNDPPEQIQLSNNEISENESNNSFIGSLSTSDPDASDKHEYALVEGEGDADNALFKVSENSIVAIASLNYEASATRNIRLRSTDKAGKTVEKAFTIQVNDINDSPTLIQLSANTVNENESADILIANLSATDEDEGESFRYELASGAGSADNGLFQIDGDKLMAKSSYNYEQNSQLQIRLKVTDSGGATYSEGFVITVIDKNDAPTNNGQIEDLEVLMKTSKFVTFPPNIFDDEDNGDVLTFTAEMEDGSLLPTWIIFKPEDRLFVLGPGSNDGGQYKIKLIGTDLKGASAELIFEVTVSVVTSLENPYSLSKLVRIYPNPVSNYLKIDLSALNGKPVDISIYDLSGTDAFTKQNFGGKELTLDLTLYKEGVYLIQLYDGESFIKQKLLVLH